MKRLLLATIFSVVSINAAGANDSPYAGQQNREIKALSIQELEDYLSGSGMGFAKAAELNHFPGPRHVLELSSELNLSQEQAKETESIFGAMKKEATALGAQLIEIERELDRRFASASIDAPTLRELVSKIGVLEARIREVHLTAHLKQRKLLTEHQIIQYVELRGYTAGRGKHRHAH